MKKLLFAPIVLGLGIAHPVWAQTVASPPQTATVPTQSGEFNVRSFGALGDGKTIDSPAINRAIDAATATGGGTVRLPAGTYLSLSVRLKSNIRLHLDAGAVLLGVKNTATRKYDAAEPNEITQFTDFGHSHWQNSLIWGIGLENVTIDGPGEIYGQGLVAGGKFVEGEGNKSIALKLCRNVTLRDFTLRHGGWFGILATGVDNFTLDNLKLDTNRDGMDIDCCRNVRLSNCSINSPGDDGLCLKSSYALGEDRATENVTITNCFVSGYDEGALLDGTRRYNPEKAWRKSPTGRIKFGTESNGGFKNITVSNCIFEKCRGLALETVDGGNLEDISISNITMRDISNAPIFLRLAARMRGPWLTGAGRPIGKLRRINISNIVVYNSTAQSGVLITGIPGHAIEDVSLSNIQIWSKGGGTKEDAALVPQEQETGYPEPDNMGTMPSYGFYLRHVKNISIDNVQLHTLTDDARPPFALDDVEGADFFRIKSDRVAATPVFAVKNSLDLTVRMVDGSADRQQKVLFGGQF